MRRFLVVIEELAPGGFHPGFPEDPSAGTGAGRFASS